MTDGEGGGWGKSEGGGFPGGLSYQFYLVTCSSVSVSSTSAPSSS